ncbi:DUF6415 family natural product biosynthesis protein [Streptomyces brasiliensis]|nr:DUF6415 family natural product biosynthesis protein [Streptomyces brasiliensis]
MSSTTYRYVPRWEPPLPAEKLRVVLAKVRGWDPLHLPSIYDDLNAVLGEHTPAVDEVDELGERLRGALAQLGCIAVADPHDEPDTATLALVERSRALRAEETSGGYRQGLGLIRRMAWTTADLIDQMVQTRQISDVD